MLKKPAGMPPRTDMDTIGEKKVLDIKFTNGSGRKKNPTAYCCAKLEGKHGQTFLVEVSQAKTPKFLEEAKDIFNNLKDHLAKYPDTNFAKLKQMASELKARIAWCQGMILEANTLKPDDIELIASLSSRKPTQDAPIYDHTITCQTHKKTEQSIWLVGLYPHKFGATLADSPIKGV